MPKKAKASDTSELTQQQLAELVELDTQRLALQREADAIDKRCKALRAHVGMVLESRGLTELTLGKYHAELVEGRPTVAWKDVVIELQGPLYAANLLEQAPRPQRVCVTAR